MSSMYQRHIGSLARFGTVGVLATMVHVCIFATFVELSIATPVVASVPAFMTALIVSYVLNRKWTFSYEGTNRSAFSKFLTVSLIGLVLNVAITYVIVNVLEIWYGFAIVLIVTLIPVLTYYLNHTWTFRQS